METSEPLQQLRRKVLSVLPVERNVLDSFLRIFHLKNVKAGEIIFRGNEYARECAFVKSGIVKAYLPNQKNRKILSGLYGSHDFLLPLPGFITRQQGYLFFEAVTDCELDLTEYFHIEELMNKHHSLYSLMHLLINSEWIVNRHHHEVAVTVYSPVARLSQFSSKFRHILFDLPTDLIAEYLQIPEKTVSAFVETEKLKNHTV